MRLTNKRVQQVARALDDTQHEHTHYPKHPYAAHPLGDDKSHAIARPDMRQMAG